MRLLFLLFAAFCLFSCSDPDSRVPEKEVFSQLGWALKQFPALDEKPMHKVMTLGVFHFDRLRDGSDVVAKNHIDIASEQNQKEILSLVQRLKQFSPGKIAVEWLPQYQPVMDSLFGAYLKGEYALEKNEAFQLGFRLAKELGHERVYCIDNNPPLPEYMDAIEDWERYADSLGHLELWQAYDHENTAYNTFMDTVQNHLFVTDYLRLINSRENTIRTKQLWTTGLVNVGHGVNYLGADLLGRWYRRNSRLYVNAKNLVEGDENLLIIYGGAHKWILDELFESSPEFQVVQIDDFFE